MANAVKNRYVSHSICERSRETPTAKGPSARKRQSESLNDVSSNGSFHDEGAHLPALLSNFDNFISREKTARYGSRSRKSPVNPIVAGELGSLRRPNVEGREPQLREEISKLGKFFLLIIEYAVGS